MAGQRKRPFGFSNYPHCSGKIGLVFDFEIILIGFRAEEKTNNYFLVLLTLILTYPKHIMKKESKCIL